MRTLLFLLLLVLPLIAEAQTADEIVERSMHFIGGEKKWKKVKTIISKGEYDYGGIVFPFTAYAKAPDHYKFVVPFNGKYYAQGFDGKSGWKIDAFKNETKPTILEGDSARAMANEANVELEIPFINYKAKGYQLRLDGKDTVEDKQCYRITLTKKNSQVETYFFDIANYSLILKIAAAKNPELQGAMLNTYFYDYRKVDGLLMAFKTVSKAGDQPVLTVIVKDVTINAPIKDEEFKPTGLN
jgi:hypothetical protein